MSADEYTTWPDGTPVQCGDLFTWKGCNGVYMVVANSHVLHLSAQEPSDSNPMDRPFLAVLFRTNTLKERIVLCNGWNNFHDKSLVRLGNIGIEGTLNKLVQT